VPIAPSQSAEETMPYPLMRSWGGDNPLPIRTLRGPVTARAAGTEAPPWLMTGAPGQPFDFCGHMHRLCTDVISRCPPLYHVDVSRLQFGLTVARHGRRHGLLARVTPMRLRDGRLTRRRRGVTFQIQRYFIDGREILYLVTFCLPRFLQLTFDEKFVTIFHELFHIGPSFHGDLRRHDGRYSVHSHSQKEYDRHMSALARDYLASHPDPNLHAFLRLDFGQLLQRHGGVMGVCVPRPKLIPLPPEQAEWLDEQTNRPAARK
jgi:Putative phage metallopeptidase